MNKKILGLLALAMLGGQSLQALTRFQVVERAAVAASIASGAAYYFSCPHENPNFFRTLKWPLKKDTATGAVPEEGSEAVPKEDSCGWRRNPDAWEPIRNAGITFVVTDFFFMWLASKYTANARHKWVNKKFKHLENQYLYNVTITDSNIEGILLEAGCESTELPLVTAFLALQTQDKLLVSMAQELNKAIKDTGSSSLRKKLKRQLEKAQTELPRIRNNEAVVKNHDKTTWLEQWKIHQKRELERERIRQQAIQTHVVWNV